MRARAVEPFFTTKPGGLGMGLTFVQDFVVHKMQGQLVLDDNVGGGLCVKIICSSFTPH
jgi:signal transduction histidine kinase